MNIIDRMLRNHFGLLILLLAMFAGGVGDSAASESYAAATGNSFRHQPGTFDQHEYRLVFGPERYVRGKGAPVAVSASFSFDESSAACTLFVKNGAAFSKNSAVHSAVIRLNGTAIIGPGSFTRPNRVIRRTVHLLPSNTLSVELRSKPGSSLVLGIACAGEPGGSGTAVWDGFNWDDNSTWQ